MAATGVIGAALRTNQPARLLKWEEASYEAADSYL